MICGGAEASITPLGVAGFASAKALSFRNEVLKQLADLLMQKEMDLLLERIWNSCFRNFRKCTKKECENLCRNIGYGTTCDAHHITAPSPGGVGGAEAIKLAIEDACLSLEKVDYINAHGTSTSANDKNETSAIKSIFRDRSYLIPVSSTKSMTGHL